MVEMLVVLVVGSFFVFLRWGGVEHQEPSGCFFTRK